MRKLGLALAVTAMLLTAQCGGGPGGMDLGTPEGLFGSFKAAMSAGEFEKVYDMLSAETQKELNEAAEEMKKQLEQQTPQSEEEEAFMEMLGEQGFTKEKLGQMTGRDMIRFSLVLGQVMMKSMAQMFGQGAEVEDIDIIAEVQKSFGAAELKEVKTTEEGKSAKFVIAMPQGNLGSGPKEPAAAEGGKPVMQTQELEIVREEGEWRLASNPMEPQAPPVAPQNAGPKTEIGPEEGTGE